LHLAHIGETGQYNTLKKKYPSPKLQSHLNILQLALPPTVRIYPSVTGKMLRALHEDSRDALRIFSALFLILLDPMDIKASDSQSSCFVCAVVLLHFHTVVFDFSL